MTRVSALALAAMSLPACLARRPVLVQVMEGYDEHLFCDRVRARLHPF